MKQRLNKVFYAVAICIFCLTFKVGYSQFSVKHHAYLYSYITGLAPDVVDRSFHRDVIKDQKFSTSRETSRVDSQARGALYSKTKARRDTFSAEGLLLSLIAHSSAAQSVFYETLSSLQSTYTIQVDEGFAGVLVTGWTSLSRHPIATMPGDSWGIYVSVVEVDEEGEVLRYIGVPDRYENLHYEARPLLAVFRINEPGTYEVRVSSYVRAAQANYPERWIAAYRASCAYNLAVRLTP